MSYTYSIIDQHGDFEFIVDIVDDEGRSMHHRIITRDGLSQLDTLVSDAVTGIASEIAAAGEPTGAGDGDAS